MVLTDFLTETRRKWLKILSAELATMTYTVQLQLQCDASADAFKLFKRHKCCRNSRNRVSPALIRSPSPGATTDATAEIDLQQFCSCRPPPPLHVATNDSYENTSYYSSLNSYNSSGDDSLQSYGSSDAGRNDSAYNSARCSPEDVGVGTVCYATVTYFNVNDSEDTSSIRTEYTLLDYDPDADGAELAEDEGTQNMINESIELVSTL